MEVESDDKYAIRQDNPSTLQHIFCYPIARKPVTLETHQQPIKTVRLGPTALWRALPTLPVVSMLAHSTSESDYSPPNPGGLPGEIPEKGGYSVEFARTESVLGNGRDTLERLIMDDDRAVDMSPLFFRRHALQLDDVIPENEVYPLVSVGTHSRGALFLDGGYLLTVALEEEINRIAVQMEGFFFGRFDIRVPSAAHLERGEGIKIMEVNGVSAEATHVYDPSTPLRHAYRVLGHQWKLAYQIGQANMRDGHRPSRIRDVLRQIYLNKINPRQKPDKSSAAISRGRVS